MMTFARDAALAMRGLLKQRGFSSAVVLTLGIAVAVASIVAAATDQALFRPLPFRDASRVVMLWERSTGNDYRLASYPTFLEWERTSRAFASLGFARGSQEVMPASEGPLRLTVAHVSPGFLAAVGATPTIGRAFTNDEERLGRGETVLLSEHLWRRQFNGDPAIVGKTLVLSGRPVTVIGVMPARMNYPPWAEMWRPISAVIDTDRALASRHHHSDSRVVGRLRAGVAPAAAMAELTTIQHRLASAYSDHGPEWTSADYKPLTWEIVGNSTPALATLAGAAALVLIVACANVATLLLLRAFSRDRDLAIRSALGASNTRLIRLPLVEGAVLAAAAAALAMVLTWWGLALLRTMAPDALPRAGELSLDGRVAALVLALSVVATSLAAVGPAIRALRGHAFEALRAGWQPTSGGRAGGKWRSILASTQLVLAVTLLAGAALLLESFGRLRNVDFGFEPVNLAAFWISPPAPKYDTAPQAAELYRRVQEAVGAVRGVDGVAITNHVPLSGGWITTNVLIPGRAPVADGSDAALYKTVSENYLRVMKGRLVRGRWFSADDFRGTGIGVVVNEKMAKHFWPDQDPVGQPLTIYRSSQFRAGFGDASPSVVLGVIGDMRHLSVADDPVEEVYVPYTREIWPGIALLVRASVDPRGLERALQRAVLEVEPALPVSGRTRWRGFQAMEDVIGRNLAPRRSVMTFVLGFAAAALALAAIGVYGVTAFGVAQRRREFGVRMAIGASSANVLTLVLSEGAKLAAFGAVAGVVGGLALTRVLPAKLDAVLYRTSPLAVLPFAVAAAVLAVVAIAAAWVPARRAARVDPVVVLRTE